ncbi:MAG: hypothetical protein JWR35_1476 [Marmoricola sp.]|nr:hypothetical protein [Marmoricola sp.]
MTKKSGGFLDRVRARLGRRDERAERAADRAAERVARRRQPQAAPAPVTQAESDERLRERIAQQWAVVRASRRHDEPVIEAGASNFSRAEVPWAVDLAAAWAWRFVIIVIAVGIVLFLIQFFAVIMLPLVIALFVAALMAPVVNAIHGIGVPRKLAALVVVLGGVALIALLLTFIGTQVSQGIDDLSQQVVDGLGKIRDWLQTGPLHASDSQIDKYVKSAQDFIQKQGTGADIIGNVTTVGKAAADILAGFFIILFSSYFFLADGKLIWAWVVRLFPRAARLRVDSSGRVAWHSLTQFVRATVLVAGTDAIGVMIIAAILKVPFVSAIGVLVFIGAFIPLIGATLSGTVAVLVALVAHGPVVALIMLGGVVLVQQIEAHVLQPFLMGRFVSVHPLGVIVAIAAGVIVAGIPGALIAVPLTAALNAVVQHLASFTAVGEDSLEAAADDPEPDPMIAADADADAADD